MWLVTVWRYTSDRLEQPLVVTIIEHKNEVVAVKV